ncbi:restriction endonuclease subunit S [uncultured Clostridium sp.]|uniref:restriction endonuclease subunit S n=1 Tax=uncultured Clostridium sp. TaxID=59620 RepID=UPI0025D6077B|nr:restriction endonuclease subunit S [uncultured Clostridium sp.]
MAKNKMTLEEKLEEAIIKDVPYKVPNNWIWSKIDSISTLVTGNTPSKKNVEYYGESVPFIKPNDLDQGRRLKTSIEMLSSLGAKKARILPKGTTAVCCIGSIGKLAYLEVEGATNQQINSIIPNRINSLYIYYYVLSEYFQRELVSNSSATTISIINKSKMGELAVPIAPLKEQQRIVDKIESLFEKLDKAKELIEEARDNFEKRKSAILEKAFNGELTKSWRYENNINVKSKIALDILADKMGAKIKELKDRGNIELGFFIPDQWEKCILNDISSVDKDSLVDGPFGSNLKTCDYTEDGVRLIQLQNIGVGYWKDNSKKYISEEKSEELSRCIALPGDIAIAKMAAPTARATIIPNIEEKYVIVADCIKLSVDYRVSTKYIMYCINSPKINNIAEALGKGTTRKRINLGDLKKIPIPLPSLEEQKEIVRILDKLLDDESKIEELTELEEQIELIKKSILAKAFRGKLGTNCEEDESALDLLKEILSKE